MTKPDIAILAKAPVPGLAKTRLIPALGAEGAARLQERFIRRAVATARGADLGPVTLWCAPDASHGAFAGFADVSLEAQPEGDLGKRIAHAFARSRGPVIVIGTDSPCLTPADLRDAASALEGADVVLAPAHDGGYALIAASRLHGVLLDGIAWGTEQVCAQTRERARRAGLSVRLMRTLWDVDRPEDLPQLATLDPPLAT